MRAESGRLNLEGAVIKNLFASFYPPLPSWQARLPLTIKDLITICKKREDGKRGRKVCQGRYAEWKMSLQRDSGQKTLGLFISSPLTSSGKIVLINTNVSMLINTKRLRCPTDYHNNVECCNVGEDSFRCVSLSRLLFGEDVHAISI